MDDNRRNDEYNSVIYMIKVFRRGNPERRIMAHRFRLWLSSIDLKKFLGAFQAYGTKNQPVKKSLSSSSFPIFSVLICCDTHQIWQVGSLVHNLKDIFYFFFKLSFLSILLDFL